MWHAAALLALLALVRRRGVQGVMSPYYKAAGKCLYKPEGAPSYEIPCSDWEAESKSWEHEQLGS